MEDIQLPRESITYILFQRTGYLTNNRLYRFFTFAESVTPFFYRFHVALRSLLFSTQITHAFSADMHKEFSSLQAHLPQGARSVLDIGCGVAGIDVLISRHYKNDIDIFLIDKTKIDTHVHYGFEKTGSFYNSLPLAVKILALNGADPRRVHTQEATENNTITFDKSFDIIISLISWGFHYPISTYLDEAYRTLNTNGVLMIDVRKNTGGEKEIEAKFGNHRIIFEEKSRIRVLAIKR